MPEFDVDSWLDEYKPRTTEARVCVRWDLLDRYSKTDVKLAEAKTDATRRKLAQELVALEAEIAEAEKVFTFQDIGGRWLALVGDNPPTKEQLAKEPDLDHNPETFIPAAIAEASVDPRLTVRQVERMRERLQLTQWQKIWAAALEANLGMAIVPKSLLAGVVLRSNGTSGTTAARKGSRAASS